MRKSPSKGITTTFPMNTTISWSIKEDVLLHSLTKQNDFINWKDVSEYFAEKNAIECAERFWKIKAISGDFEDISLDSQRIILNRILFFYF